MNIRELNKITKLNSYSLLLQSDIIFVVARFLFIFTINGNNYFYQFLMRYKDKYKFTIVFHRDQKQYNVILIKYKGSSPYVQRQTDKIFKSIRDFARVYVNDMIAFSKTLSQHFEHLRKMFSLFRERRINFNFKKLFLKYPFVTLLKQRVDFLNLFISKKKFAAIFSFQFPKFFRKLKTFLKLIE